MTRSDSSGERCDPPRNPGRHVNQATLGHPPRSLSDAIAPVPVPQPTGILRDRRDGLEPCQGAGSAEERAHPHGRTAQVDDAAAGRGIAVAGVDEHRGAHERRAEHWAVIDRRGSDWDGLDVGCRKGAVIARAVHGRAILGQVQGVHTIGGRRGTAGLRGRCRCRRAEGEGGQHCGRQYHRRGRRANAGTAEGSANDHRDAACWHLNPPNGAFDPCVEVCR